MLMNNQDLGKRISIQVSLNGYSFKIEDGGKTSFSEWLPMDRVFSVPELQQRYDKVTVSLLTPKTTLVPASFFDPEKAREALSEVARLDEGDVVEHFPVPSLDAEIVYSLSIGETFSRSISRMTPDSSGIPSRVVPEMYCLLEDFGKISDYNRILASYGDSHLYLVIGQGQNLLLSNVFDAPDFVSAQYFIFLAMKKLQLNPAMSAIYFRTPLSREEELSLYRYFNSVERI